MPSFYELEQLPEGFEDYIDPSKDKFSTKPVFLEASRNAMKAIADRILEFHNQPITDRGVGVYRGKGTPVNIKDQLVAYAADHRYRGLLNVGFEVEKPESSELQILKSYPREIIHDQRWIRAAAISRHTEDVVFYFPGILSFTSNAKPGSSWSASAHFYPGQADGVDWKVALRNQLSSLNAHFLKYNGMTDPYVGGRADGNSR